LLQVFAIGILINCLAHVPFTLIQSAGAARLTAVAHFVQLPFFLAALWWLTSTFGTLGAAIAWLLRMVLDSFLMFALCSPLLGRTAKSLLNLKVLSFLLLAAGGFVGVLIQSEVMRALWLILLIGVLAMKVWASCKTSRA
jgi:hypothetical protein